MDPHASDDPRALCRLGLALRAQGRTSEALAPLQRALRLDPAQPTALAALGDLLLERGAVADATVLFRGACALAPGSAIHRRNLALARLAARDVVAARAEVERALELDPRDAETRVALGVVLEAEGALERAREAFESACALDPDCVAALVHRAQADPAAEPGPLERRLARGGDRGERRSLHFALGTVHDRRGEPERAFASFRAGNELAGAVYDPGPERAELEGLECLAQPEAFARRASFGDPTRRPVFVVGMPRSGTTLVERLLAAHPRVVGLGEHRELGAIARELAAAAAPRPWLEGLLELPREAVRALAWRYLASLGEHAGGEALVVDKTPANYRYLPLVALLFPNARVVHCRRDPRDAGLSAYFQEFAAGACLFSYDLEDIATCHRLYERTMHHWADLPVPARLDVRYEELVADPEGGTARVLAFLGLDWDARCLRFHESDAPVFSASRRQVRQPTHGRSVGRWRAYARFLGSLAELADPGPAEGPDAPPDGP